MTIAQLQREFAKLNDRYFNGRLPHFTIRLFVDGTGKHADAAAYTDGVAQVIAFAHNWLARASDAEAITVLKHELCHIGQPADEQNHGATWLDRMCRFHAEGWVTDHVRQILDHD